jgi:hypothetical protein
MKLHLTSLLISLSLAGGAVVAKPMVSSAAEEQATRMAQVYPLRGQYPRGSLHLQQELAVIGAPHPLQLAASKNHQFVGKHAGERPVLPNRHFILKTPKRNKQPNEIKGFCSLTICRTTLLPPTREEPGDLYRYYYYSPRQDGQQACLLFRALIMRGNHEAVLRVESHNLRTVRLKLWFPYRKSYVSEMDLDPGESLRLSIPTDPGWPRQNAPELHFMGFKHESVSPESSQDVKQQRMHSNTLNLNASPWQSHSQPIEHHLSSTSSYHNPPVQSSNVGTELIRPFQTPQLEHLVSFPPSSSDFSKSLSGLVSTVLPESGPLVRTSGSSEEDQLGFVTPLTFEFMDFPSVSEIDQVHGE